MATSPTTVRNDVLALALLEIIDIVQNDAAPNTVAGGGGNPGAVHSFVATPARLSGTVTTFQDDQAQTSFWAKFVAQDNLLNN
jgi:hypothetical protein